MAGHSVEQLLIEAFAPHGVLVRAERASFHHQMWFGASNRIRRFYCRREDSIQVYGPTNSYDISERHSWPTLGQMTDPEFVKVLVEECLAELDTCKKKREERHARFQPHC